MLFQIRCIDRTFVNTSRRDLLNEDEKQPLKFDLDEKKSTCVIMNIKEMNMEILKIGINKCLSKNIIYIVEIETKTNKCLIKITIYIIELVLNTYIKIKNLITIHQQRNLRLGD